VQFARSTFLAGERVEMGALAGQLDISQATIYRWFGSRERLLEEVIDGLAREFIATAKAESTGEGDERVLDFLRRFMELSATLEPYRAFVEREPQLALRLLLGEEGIVRRTLREAIAEEVQATRPEPEARALDDELDMLVEIGVALEWATLAIGEGPRTDHAIHIMGVMLAAHSRAGG
jgi:AcrR family transcriptional regulator